MSSFSVACLLSYNSITTQVKLVFVNLIISGINLIEGWTELVCEISLRSYIDMIDVSVRKKNRLLSWALGNL